MRTFILFFLVSTSLFSQVKQLIEIKIDTITFDDKDIKLRKFILKYHIKNLTKQKLSFFFDGNSLLPANRASMATSPYYKIFQNDEIVSVSNIFSNQNNRSKKKDPLKIVKDFQKEVDSIYTIYKKSDNPTDIANKLWVYQNHELLKDKIVLEPNEVKKYSIDLFWDKERYFIQDDLEYYLDENQKHYFDLNVNIMKEEYKNKLNENDYKNMMEDKNFIKGVFYSNKMEINFK